MTIVEDLRALPLFHGISETRLNQLVSVLHPIPHQAGTVLFRPGDTATHFEILTRGQVTLERIALHERALLRGGRALRPAPHHDPRRARRADGHPAEHHRDGDDGLELLSIPSATSSASSTATPTSGSRSTRTSSASSATRSAAIAAASRTCGEHHPHAEGDEADARDVLARRGDGDLEARSSSRSITLIDNNRRANYRVRRRRVPGAGASRRRPSRSRSSR